MRPMRSGAKTSCWARPTWWATVVRWFMVAGSRSIQWSTSRIGTTRVWPGCRGLMDRKATAVSSRHTNRPGSSPSMMRVKIVAMPGW